MPARKLLVALPALILCVVGTGAHAVVIGFDSLETATGSIHRISGPYTEGGFQIAGYPLTHFGQGNAMYAGSAGLLVATAGGTATLTQSGGGLGFGLNSIDLSYIYPTGTSGPVTFTGLTGANKLVTQSFTPVKFGFSRFDFNSSFASLQSVSWTQGKNALNGHQFDNINVTTAPEPGTLGLIGLALLGLAFGRRAKSD